MVLGIHAIDNEFWSAPKSRMKGVCLGTSTEPGFERRDSMTASRGPLRQAGSAPFSAELTLLRARRVTWSPFFSERGQFLSLAPKDISFANSQPIFGTHDQAH